MEIILFQIGESEEKIEKNGEICRVLTKQSAKAVADAAGGLGRVIPRKVKVQVWSSMAAPSSQTAEIIAEELGVKRKFLRSLDTSDLDTLLRTAFEHGREECLILIGQQPNLGDWVEKLTGLKLPFRPAAAAGLAIDPAAPDHGELLWFIQPKYLKNIG